MQQKKEYLFISFVFLYLLLFASCQKNIQTIVSKKELLTGTRWQVVSLIYQQVGLPGTSQMISVKYKPCELDDLYEFKKDSSFLRKDEAIACSPGLRFGPTGGIWTADPGFTKITIDISGGYHADFNVGILTADLLEWENVYKDYLGNTISYTYLFKGVH